MRFMTVLVLSSVAALASAKYARAEDASPAAEQQPAEAVYQGVDTGGRRVSLTISADGSDVRVRVDRRPALPEPHWTSLIGTGAAAALER
jgi:hypothetical protein